MTDSTGWGDVTRVFRSTAKQLRCASAACACTLLLGCTLSTEGCPSPTAIPVHVNVVEDVTGARLTRNATAVLTGLVSVDTSIVVNGIADFLVPPEREGAYSLRITSFGYNDWERNNISIARAAACTRNASVGIDARLTVTTAGSIAAR